MQIDWLLNMNLVIKLEISNELMSSILQANQDFMFSTKILNASLKVASPLSSYKVLRRYFFINTYSCLLWCQDTKYFFPKIFLFMQIIKWGFFLDLFFNNVFHSTLLIYQHFSFFFLNFGCSFIVWWTISLATTMMTMIILAFPLVDILNYVDNFLLFIYWVW